MIKVHTSCYVMEIAEINTKKLFLLHSLQFLTSLWNGNGYGAPFRHALSARTAIVLLTILTRFASIVLWFAAWFFLHCINTTSCKLGNLLPYIFIIWKYYNSVKRQIS